MTVKNSSYIASYTVTIMMLIINNIIAELAAIPVYAVNNHPTIAILSILTVFTCSYGSGNGPNGPNGLFDTGSANTKNSNMTVIL